MITATELDHVPGAEDPEVTAVSVVSRRHPSPRRSARLLMTHFDRSPRLLSGTLEVLAQRLAPETVLADAQRAWPKAVGAAIAERGEARFRSGPEY